MLEFMYITNNLHVAKIAEEAGVDRIWLDLETLGKEDRQKGMNTVISKHSIDDIGKIKSVLNASKVQTRINPINDASATEIEAVISQGTDYIMLPMFRTSEEVKIFVNQVHGRAKTIMLFETKESVENLDDILAVQGIDEIHIGLNDLHLSYGMKFLFEPLANGLVENICKKIQACEIPYGFGGIARIGQGMLPADLIIGEHYRLKSTRVILSRSFCNPDDVTDLARLREEFKRELARVKAYEKGVANWTETAYEENKKLLGEKVDQIIGR